MAQSNFDLAGKAVEQFFKDGGDTSNDNKLALYKFFKQGNVGDCNTDRPGGLNPFSKDKAKWDAWNSAKGQSKEDAQAEYIKLAKSIVPESLANTF